MGSQVILLTAALRPNIVQPGVVVDESVRRKHYRRAFDSWRAVSHRLDAGLVVVETTGAAAEELTGGSPGIRWFSHSPDIADLQRGKGAAESGAIDHVISELSTDLDSTTTIHKVTGRLILGNPDEVLTTVELGRARVRRTLDRSYCDTRLLSAPLAIWRQILSGMSGEVDDAGGRFLEHVVAQRLICAEFSNELHVESFVVRPHIVGVSGQTGAIYGSGLSRLRGRLLMPAERALRSLARTKQV